MVSLLVYAYCVGERASRQIERLCQRDIAFRYIMGNRIPDHTTIARFRQEHEEALAANRSREQIEAEVRRMLAEAKATDAEGDAAYVPERRGDEQPEELREPGSRRARLEAARQRLAHQEEEVQRAQDERSWRRAGPRSKPPARRSGAASPGRPKRWCRRGSRPTSPTRRAAS